MFGLFAIWQPAVPLLQRHLLKHFPFGYERLRIRVQPVILHSIMRFPAFSLLYLFFSFHLLPFCVQLLRPFSFFRLQVVFQGCVIFQDLFQLQTVPEAPEYFSQRIKVFFRILHYAFVLPSRNLPVVFVLSFQKVHYQVLKEFHFFRVLYLQGVGPFLVCGFLPCCLLWILQGLQYLKMSRICLSLFSVYNRQLLRTFPQRLCLPHRRLLLKGGLCHQLVFL